MYHASDQSSYHASNQPSYHASNHTNCHASYNDYIKVKKLKNKTYIIFGTTL